MSQITNDLNLAIARLNNQDVVAIPTETVYGLAADATCEPAIRKVFTLKQRPIDHPLIMHIAPEWDLNNWAINIPAYAKQLIQLYWPGPLTLVLQMRKGAINPLVTGGQDTLAIRVPSHPIALELIRRFGKPIVAPSANLFGKISPTTAKHVAESFINQDVLVLNGDRCVVGIESTIVLATKPHEYKILRPGIIDELQLNTATNIALDNTTSKIRVSGALKHHYQPEKILYYVEYGTVIAQAPDEFLLHFSAHSTTNFSFKFDLNPQQVAHELYYQLRKADESNVERIIIELPPNTKIWQALRDRIMKASSEILK